MFVNPLPDYGKITATLQMNPQSPRPRLIGLNPAGAVSCHDLNLVTRRAADNGVCNGCLVNFAGQNGDYCQPKKTGRTTWTGN